MPNGNKRRPDTLELEVLGTRQLHDSSSDDETGYKSRQNTTDSNIRAKLPLPFPVETISTNLTPSQKQREEEKTLHTSIQTQKTASPARRRRWFRFQRTKTPASDEVITTYSTPATTSTTATTNTATASLAKPEHTSVAGSTSHIVAPLTGSQTTHDVSNALPPRNNSKQRRRSSRTKTESLYSIATLAETGEVQLQPRSEPNVHNDYDNVSWTNARTRPASAVAKECEVPIFIEKPADEVLLTQQPDEQEAPVTGLRASLMSVLGKLAIWKRSNCRRRSRTNSATKDGAAAGHDGNNGLSGRKSINASVDFEHLSANSGTAGGFEGIRKKSIRRLSQIRRRRSSYYFSDNERRIRANEREFNAQFKYADNYIKTSKYSMLTFLPFNLLEQFQRLANFYFLCLLVLQLIPAISSLTPVTTAIPLIGVLTLTAVKDAYDDIQRHLSDSQVNNRRSKTLRNGKLVDEKWSGVQVGDVIRMENNQFVAADILLLTTSEPNGLCFIETAELDGETNLKCKQCLPETTELGQRHDLLWHFNGEIICERPNNLLNKFEGTLMWKNQRYALDNEKILLRGCVLRNTQWCYGVVIFAGKDTKLMQNSGKTQFKSTGVDRLLNFIIIGIVLFLLSICAFFTLACAIWEGLIGQHFQVYLPWEHIIPKNVPQGATVIGLLVFFSYAIVLNTVVPISLYVSVEVIRFAQSFLINWDEKMFYEKSKTPAKARTTTLNEELGQIQYIFSDKTGTLTQNIMTFNKCSINGRAYGDVIDLRTGEVIEVTEKQILQNSNNKSTPPTIFLHSAEVYPKSTLVVTTPTDEDQEETNPTTVTPLASSIATPSTPPDKPSAIAATTATTPTCSTAKLANDVAALKNNSLNTASGSEVSSFQSSLNSIYGTKVKTKHFQYAEPTGTTTSTETSMGDGMSPTSQQRQIRRQRSTLSSDSEKALKPVDFSANPEYEPEFRWYDHTLLDAVRSDEEHAHNFFRLLALCHTVMPEYVEGRLEYQAQSPDESALVSAARNFGFVFRSRTPNSITIEVMGRTEEYELLSILDFNNVRKRMSVILRRNNRIVLYCKGADNVIYDRLDSSQHDIKGRTQEHLNKFAGEGLRTLVLAERHLDLAYFDSWKLRQRDASLSMDGRDDKLDVLYEEIESDLLLVGVTAIEDKLQDGVPQTIANLQMAGIKIWVLTGDKQETAINIGYSCQLLTDELADVFIVDGSSMDEVDKQLRQFKESIRIVNRFRPTPLEPAVNLNLNGSSRDSSVINHSAFRANVSPPPLPPPAISVVTFSAECNELYDNLEKGDKIPVILSDEDIMPENTGFALVINGHSLVYCLSPELEARFLDIASQCKAVICCRVTPLQKALVVELIKRAKHAVTLAIGDGANDVSMIKAAHIGVGISGQEGLQAVLASDYSIAQFRYLERLLLVHGRWSYYRMCKFLRYFFYKNFAFTLCHCWFSFFCGFSAQTVFDPMFISVYNLFYTSLPVLALGVFEQDVSDKHSVEYPKLYTPGLKSQLFNTKEFVYSVLHGAFSSMVLFLIPYGTYKDGVSPNGLILSDHMTLGAVVATILIIDNTAQIALYTSYWTIVNHIMIWGSLVWYFVLDYFYNYVVGGPYVGSLTQAMKDLTFWATMFITVAVIMAPVLAYKFYLVDVCPSLTDKIRLKQRQANIRSRQTTHVMRTPSARRARRSLRSGYAFAHQEGFGRLITSGKIMRKLPQEFAFPLGLGSKRVQSTSAPVDATQTNHQNNNNLGTKDNKNSTNGLKKSRSSDVAGSSEEDLSPRAPCQDLDTINL